MKMQTLTTLFPGILVAVLLAAPLTLAAAGDDREILYWVAPMDANYRRDKPGKVIDMAAKSAGSKTEST